MDEAKTNIILNENYKDYKILFEKGEGDKIFFKNKAYVDLSYCYGSLILGHNSSVFKKSLKLYLNKKISIFAHPNTHAINFSKNIKKKFPNFSKIIFCNSGSEAVMKSLRLSKSLNKKNLIVNVAGSWHGSVDKLLFYPNKNLKPQKLSDGLSLDDKKKLIYIPYNDIDKSNKILNKFKNDINCIIIEPIQACLPLDNVKKYLQFLERFCKKNNSTLIFDEIITGIRIRSGSIQRKYNINADITTVGKILGGGLPIGVIGISEKVNKIIKKKNIKVFFGGTFSGNSLSSFVGNETLKFLLKNKVLFSNLNKKSLYFQKNLNQFITKEGIEAKVYRFDSILRIVFSTEAINNRIQRDFFEKKNIFNIVKFRQYLLDNKIYYPTNGVIFLSNATSYKSINYVLNHIKIGLKKIFTK
jgi:glutamate-1-semialdehyde 2,1-aminomutase